MNLQILLLIWCLSPQNATTKCRQNANKALSALHMRICSCLSPALPAILVSRDSRWDRDT